MCVFVCETVVWLCVVLCVLESESKRRESRERGMGRVACVLEEERKKRGEERREGERRRKERGEERREGSERCVCVCVCVCVCACVRARVVGPEYRQEVVLCFV